MGVPGTMEHRPFHENHQISMGLTRFDKDIAAPCQIFVQPAEKLCKESGILISEMGYSFAFKPDAK